MGTRVRGHACRRPETRRLLVIGAALTAALGLAAEAQAAVRASVAGGTLTVTGTPAGERIAGSGFGLTTTASAFDVSTQPVISYQSSPFEWK